MEYTFTELFWLLLVYSFIGWVIEAMVGSIKNKRFTNRGFSTGPFCLVYGVAVVIMELTLSELIDNPFFFSSAAASRRPSSSGSQGRCWNA